jgi:DNA repair ATPase RecN
MSEYNRRSEDATIQVIAERINTMQNDMSDLRDTMRDSMKDMSAAITKLVQMEERQIHMNQSYDRLNGHLDKFTDKLEKLESRLVSLEVSEPMQKQTSEWIGKAVWAIVAASAAFAAKSLGFL